MIITPKPKICRYCGSPVVFTSNAEVYGKEYGTGKCYLCRNCGAFVGVHPGTDKPLGTLANDELRQYRKEAHFWFDKIWMKPLRLSTRSQAYSWLAEELGIPEEKTHIGMFEKEECEMTTKLAKARIKEGRANGI